MLYKGAVVLAAGVAAATTTAATCAIDRRSLQPPHYGCSRSVVDVYVNAIITTTTTQLQLCRGCSDLRSIAQVAY